MPHGATGQPRISIKPTYDVARGTKDDFFPFEPIKALSSFTLSSAVIAGDQDTLDSITSYQVAADIPALVQKQDTIAGYTWGDNTQLETIFFIKTNSSYEVTQCFVQAAFAMNLTAWTDNGATFTSIDFEVRKFLGGNKTNFEVLLRRTVDTGFAEQVGADAADIYIFKAQFSGEHISPSDTIGLYFKCNVSQTATNTYQSMILPLFSYAVLDVTKTFYQSGMASHALPSFDNAAPAFKDQISGYPIDSFGSPII